MHTDRCTVVQVIEDAGREFLGGPEQALVAIAKAELSLARGEADAALSILMYGDTHKLLFPHHA